MTDLATSRREQEGLRRPRSSSSLPPERRWKAGGDRMETAFGTPGVGRAGHGRIRPYGMRSTMRERHQRARTKPLGGGGIQR